MTKRKNQLVLENKASTLINEVKMKHESLFFLGIAFIGGASIMGLELIASRVLAPGFGTSIHVWGALLGVVMLGLALGYYIGGIVSDRSDDKKKLLFKIIGISAVLIAMIPIYSWILVILLSRLGLMAGALLSSLIIFVPPMTLLAMISPIIIKIYANDLNKLGGDVGLVYSISTVGGITGTFATAFLLIPYIGSRYSTLLISVILLAIYLIGSISFLGRNKKGFSMVILIVTAALVMSAVSLGNFNKIGTIYYTESEYNIIKVIDEPDARILKLNYDLMLQSKTPKTHILTGDYWDIYTIGPVLKKTDKILWIGMGAGTSARQLLYFYNISVDAVEIDPKVIEVALDYFYLDKIERLRIYAADGRTFLSNSKERYDIINVDTFNGGIDIPFHLATKEFYDVVSSHLVDDGLLMINILSMNQDMQVRDHVARTLKKVYPSVYNVDLDGNQILLAFKKKTDLDDLQRLLEDVNPKLESVRDKFKKMTEFQSDRGMILTDDKSNIEELTYNMIKG